MPEHFDPEVMEQVSDFYAQLDEEASDRFDAVVEQLIARGPSLPRPYSGEIDLRKERAAADLFGNRLKELRLGTLRVLYTFGPDRVPVLLFAGDKVGDWGRWYPGAIKAATRSYREYLEDL